MLAAPRVAWTPPPGRERRWGVFLPLYALRTERSRRRGIADLADLGALFDWLHRRGGDAVVSLPLLAAQLDRVGDAPAEYSPYAPLSRRAWNELYADLDDLPRRRAASADPARRSGPRSGPPAGLPGGLGLEAGAARRGGRRPSSQPAGTATPAIAASSSPSRVAARYARFRAVAARHGADWRAWPERFRHPGRRRRWAVGRRGPGRGRALPPLRPVGDGASAGRRWPSGSRAVASSSPSTCRSAPTPTASTSGTTRTASWAMPVSAPRPTSSSRSARTGGSRRCTPSGPGRPVTATCAPASSTTSATPGCSASTTSSASSACSGCGRARWRPGGAYVRYPREELFACLTLAAAERGAMVVGENLGTVPVEVDQALARHRVLGTYVLQFAWEDLLGRRLPAARRGRGRHVRDPRHGDLRGDLVGRRSGRPPRPRAARRRRAGHRGTATGRAAPGGDRLVGPRPTTPARPPSCRAPPGRWRTAPPPSSSSTPRTAGSRRGPRTCPARPTSVRPNWRLTAAHPLEAWDELPGVLDTVDTLAAARPRPGSHHPAGRRQSERWRWHAWPVGR